MLMMRVQRLSLLLLAILCAWSGPAHAAYDQGVTLPPGVQGTNSKHALASEIDVTWPKYGAVCDGSTDDAAAINAALADGAAMNLPVTGSFHTCRIASPISTDLCHTTLHNITILAPGITSGGITQWTTTCTDPNTMSGIHMQHPVSGVKVQGPNTNGATSACFQLVPTIIGGTPWIPGVVIEHGQAAQCFEGVAFNNGAFNDTLRDMHITAPPGPFFGVDVNGPTNSGEGIVLDNLFIETGGGTGSATGCGVWVAETADVHFINSKIDGSACFIEAQSSGATIFADNDHFEDVNSPDTNFMLIANTTDSKIRVTNSFFVLDQGITRTFPIGLSNVAGASLNTGGIFFSGNSFEFGSGSYVFDYLVTGPGPCSSGADTFTTNLTKALTCLAGIPIRMPLFNTGTPDFTVSGTAPTLFASGGPNIPQGQTSASYIALNNTSGAVSLTSGKYACKPGQSVMLSFYESSTGMAASGSTFSYDIFFLDGLGNQFTGQGATITTDSTPFVKALPSGQAPVPQGTVSCTVFLNLGAPTSSNAVFNLTDVIFEAQ